MCEHFKKNNQIIFLNHCEFRVIVIAKHELDIFVYTTHIVETHDLILS